MGMAQKRGHFWERLVDWGLEGGLGGSSFGGAGPGP
jgi:hypothetical protein